MRESLGIRQLDNFGPSSSAWIFAYTAFRGMVNRGDVALIFRETMLGDAHARNVSTKVGNRSSDRHSIEVRVSFSCAKNGFGKSSERYFDICRDQGSCPFMDGLPLSFSRPHGFRQLGILALSKSGPPPYIPKFMQGRLLLRYLPARC